jgi:hypothetical protein
MWDPIGPPRPVTGELYFTGKRKILLISRTPIAAIQWVLDDPSFGGG